MGTFYKNNNFYLIIVDSKIVVLNNTLTATGPFYILQGYPHTTCNSTTDRNMFVSTGQNGKIEF